MKKMVIVPWDTSLLYFFTCMVAYTEISYSHFLPFFKYFFLLCMNKVFFLFFKMVLVDNIYCLIKFFLPLYCVWTIEGWCNLLVICTLLCLESFIEPFRVVVHYLTVMYLSQTSLLYFTFLNCLFRICYSFLSQLKTSILCLKL